MKHRIKHYNWTGLYDQSWKGVIVPGAFVHPGKYSRALIRRIYQFMFEQKWLHEGDTVIDPFGGVGLGALDALTMGLNWTGIELEPRFCVLAQENIALWDKRYKGRLPRWGSAQIIQGDSRKLLDVIAGAGAIASSPPYAQAMKGEKTSDKQRQRKAERYARGEFKAVRPDVYTSEKNIASIGFFDGAYGDTPGQLAALREGDVQAAISSPPYAGSEIRGGAELASVPIGKRWKNEHRTVRKDESGYGTSEGQLGSMPEGIISSPPYSAARVGDECGQEHVGHNGNYGKSDGQLGSMSEGALVSSPPYEDGGLGSRNEAWFEREASGKYQRVGVSNYHDGNYGETDGQLAKSDTFWSAARLIVAQAYAALAPGAHAAWVLKSFVRNKAIVDFPAQWQELAESVGFETVAIARAWQTKDDGTQLATDGNHRRLTKERKGFFRRLHEKKYPDTKIDFEIVLFQVKP